MTPAYNPAKMDSARGTPTGTCGADVESLEPIAPFTTLEA